MGIWETVLPAAAASAGSLLAYSGQRETNAVNIGMNERVLEYNHQEAANNRQWQERMSNTAMQRQVKDYVKAGINPLLGLGNGAATPSGAVASGTPTKIDNPMAQFAASASEMASLMLAARKQKAEIDLMGKQSELTDAQKAKANMETKVMSKDVPKAELMNDLYDIARPIVKKIKGASQTGSKTYQKMESDQKKWEQDGLKKGYNVTLPKLN